MMRIVFVAVGLALAMVACAPADQPSTEDNKAQELLLKYAQCMRDNGVSLPDPVAGEPGSMYEGVDQQAPEFTSADAVCAPILQGVVADREQQQGADPEQQQEEMLALAQCLRDHGIDVPDPVPGAEQPFGDSLDRTDPAVAAALAECTEAGQ